MSSSTREISTHSDIILQAPPKLPGRSNYNNWRSTMISELTATSLWPLFHTPEAMFTPLDSTELRPDAKAQAAWEKHNISACRMIRLSVAINVQAFIRSMTNAAELWERLETLFGDTADADWT